eukprot:6863658-Prymnesium_polylepis.1
MKISRGGFLGRVPPAPPAAARRAAARRLWRRSAVAALSLQKAHAGERQRALLAKVATDPRTGA